MGCLMAKKSSNDETEVPLADASAGQTYSWSNRDKTDLSRFVIENVHGSIALRRQHEIAGQGIVIQNCNRATLVLLDYSATVLIDDCVDCTIFVAPVTGSVALRNCTDCRIMSASQQFRTRDCNNLDCFIYSATQPVIESSQRLRFGPFSADFQDLDQLFVLANLDVFNNKCHQVYDFCADEQFEKHYTILTADFEIDQLFQPLVLALKNEPINFCLTPNVVPFTVGMTQSDILKMVEGNVKDLLVLLIAVNEGAVDQMRVIQERLSRAHLLPHDQIVPLLARSFHGSNRSFLHLRQLFASESEGEVQKIIAVLYKHSPGYSVITLDNNSALIPTDIREPGLENVRTKVLDSNVHTNEFSEILSMFDYK